MEVFHQTYNKCNCWRQCCCQRLQSSSVIDGSAGEWLTLNAKINTYPSARRYTTIGLGGDDFVQSMVVAVESVIQHPVLQISSLLRRCYCSTRLRTMSYGGYGDRRFSFCSVLFLASSIFRLIRGDQRERKAHKAGQETHSG